MSDVYFDGFLMGTVGNLASFANQLRKARRAGKLSSFLNFYVDEDLGSLFIHTDRSRVRRPLIIVENGKSVLTDTEKKKLASGEMRWSDLVKSGVVEYLDAAEEENALIALNESDLTKKHTHLELDPLGIFGLSLSLVPYANFAPTPKTLRGQKTQKQAMGCYAKNFLMRMDVNQDVLVYPHKPITQTFMHKVFDIDKSSGQNIVIAVMNYEGYNMDDATVINRASMERGFGRSLHFRPYAAEKLRYAGGQVDDILIPDKDVQGYTLEGDYRFLTDDGVTYVEADVSGGDVIIGKTSPPRFLGKLENFSTAANIRKDTSIRMRYNETGTVSEVLLTESKDGNFLVKVGVRQPRNIELGDKMSSRAGQKGVVGHIVDPKDMPFTAGGIVPDLIFSPNGLPKRMTVSHMIEILAAKVGALSGRYVDGTAFASENLMELRKELLELGFREDGTETVYDGRTGKKYEAQIFVGSIYYLRLYHQVADRMQSRGRGPIQLLTRQPTEGKVKEGGTRLGEMEKEALVAHGTSLLIKERFDSDRSVVHVCDKCGDLALFDQYKNRAVCLNCGEKSTASPIEMSYAFKLFLDELKSLGIKSQLILKERY